MSSRHCYPCPSLASRKSLGTCSWMHNSHGHSPWFHPHERRNLCKAWIRRIHPDVVQQELGRATALPHHLKERGLVLPLPRHLNHQKERGLVLPLLHLKERGLVLPLPHHPAGGHPQSHRSRTHHLPIPLG